MPPFIFLGLILLFLLWMLCTWIDERDPCDMPSAPVVSEKGDAGHSGENLLLQPLSGKKDTNWIKDAAYSSLRRQPKIRDQRSLSLSEDNPPDEHPHDPTEYPHETPDALRPRRVVLARPPEEDEEEGQNSVVKKNFTTQKDETSLKAHHSCTPYPKENNVLSGNNDRIRTPSSTYNESTQTETEEKPLKISVGTQKDVETEEWSIQTDTPLLRASRGVQVGVEQEDIEVETLPFATNRESQTNLITMDAEVQTQALEQAVVSASPSRTLESEGESESFESYPLKPKYLSSSSQSEEESEQASSESSGALRQRYSILQPFMGEEE
jgi:hypothetical protein